MNQTPAIASELLANPTVDLQRLMVDPRTSDEARDAVASLVSPPSSTQHLNGTTNGVPVNVVGDGRLQVVNENQEFTYVLSPLT